MSSAQIVVTLSVVTALLALWAAVFATRADRAARRGIKLADRRWEASTRPVPHLAFTGPAATGQAIELEVENLGGTLAAGGVIVQSGDDLYAGELTLPEKAPPRLMAFPPVMKAWQKAKHPGFVLVAGRDVSGRWWDCLNGAKIIKNPRQWVESHLKDLRLQGAVSFPELSGAPSPRR